MKIHLCEISSGGQRAPRTDAMAEWTYDKIFVNRNQNTLPQGRLGSSSILTFFHKKTQSSGQV
jgi:hypothetical protein